MEFHNSEIRETRVNIPHYSQGPKCKHNNEYIYILMCLICLYWKLKYLIQFL